MIFTLIGGVLLLGDAMPDQFGVAGLILIIVGMVANSFMSA